MAKKVQRCIYTGDPMYNLTVYLKFTNADTEASFVTENVKKSEWLYLPAVVLTAILLVVESLEFTMWLPAYVLLCLVPKYVAKRLTPMQLRLFLILPSCVFAYAIASVNIFLAFLPSLFFHLLTILHWCSYGLVSLPELVIAIALSPAIFDTIVIWMTMGFVICLLEKDRKYSWILLDSNRRSVSLVKGLFNQNSDAVLLIDANNRCIKSNNAGKQLMKLTPLTELVEQEQIADMLKKG
jgi:hypothetical protein